MNKKSKALGTQLLRWYRRHGRDLPWRHSDDPYAIWLSEVLLQQTTIAQGTPYYERFIEALPTVEALAAAPLDQVLKLWEGLGYYSRARNLHSAAQYVMSELDGSIPTTHAGLLTLKGIGEYTAAAIASIAYGLPHPVVDGNVLRVMSRLYGITEAVDLSSTKKKILELSRALMASHPPGDYNEAIMDLGATICKPRQPLCASCPFESHCIANQKDLTLTLPVKSKKIKKRSRLFLFLHIEDGKGRSLLEQRGPKDVWQGLYQYPLLELPVSASTADMQPEALPPPFTKLSIRSATLSECYKQNLTHQRLSCHFLHIRLKGRIPKALSDIYTSYDAAQQEDLPFPKVINEYKGSF